MYTKLTLSIAFILHSLIFLGQKQIFVSINPMIGSQPLNLNSFQALPSGGNIKVSVFDYYVSELKVYHDGGAVIDRSDSVFLVEPNQYVLFLGTHNVTQIDSISFLVGVTKRLNTINGSNAVDISSYPETHPLSFQSPSMYWGWSAGYMHMIISSGFDGDMNNVQDAYFELHNLGFNNVHYVKMNVTPTYTNAQQIDIHLQCNIDQWIRGVALNTIGISHGDTGENAQVLANVNVYGVFTQPQTASVGEIADEIYLNWTKNHEIVEIKYDALRPGMQMQIASLDGKVITSKKIDKSSGSFSFKTNEKVLLISIFDNANCFYSKKIWND